MEPYNGGTAGSRRIYPALWNYGISSEDVYKRQIQSLARATFSSPSTITRFCRKLGLDGYKKFQILFYSEYEAFANQGVVDANYPFSGNRCV